LLAAVFWGRKDMLMVEFVKKGATMLSKVYRKTLGKQRRAGHSKQWVQNYNIWCSAREFLVHFK
jgi:hypothetical protein